jgi:hypothetical protein
MKVDKINPETLEIIETYDCINAIIINNTNEDYTYNQLYRSIKENNVYRNYRWNYNGFEIRPTNKEMKIGSKIERIIKLNKSHEVVKIYSTKTEVLNELKTHNNKLKKILDDQIIIDNHYYMTEENYSGDIPLEEEDYKIFNSKEIKETNTETNEVIIYGSMKELWTKRGITRHCLNSCIKENRICDKYRWEYVNPEQNKNNCKKIRETNQKTNKVIIYNSMKEVYSKRELNNDKLRKLIRNNIPFNDYIYEEVI